MERVDERPALSSLCGRWFALVLVLLMMAGGFVGSVYAQDKNRATERFRGGKVAWVRLQSSDPQWARHAASDDALIGFIRAHTTLDIDPNWHSVRADKLENLTRYPFVYAASLAYLSRDEERNLTEYLRRGGFVFVDACVNENINPDSGVFLKKHLQFFREMFPDFRVVALKQEHEVFSIYFKMQRFPPQQNGSLGWTSARSNPLLMLYAGDRVVGIISTSGLQCGWAGYSGADDTPASYMKMMTNIYVYVMTR